MQQIGCKIRQILFFLLFIVGSRGDLQAAYSGRWYSEAEAPAVEAWSRKLSGMNGGLQTFDSAVRYAASINSERAFFKFRYAYAYSLFSSGLYRQCGDTLSLLRNSVGRYVDTTFRATDGKDSSWRSLYIDILVLSGQVELYLENYVGASQLFAKTMRLYGHDTLSTVAAQCYNGMGTVLAYMQHEESALEYMFKALHIFKLHKDYKYVSLVCANISAVYYKASQDDLALKYALESYEAILQVADRNQELYLHTMLSLALSYQGVSNYSQSEKYYVEALEQAKVFNLQHSAVFIRYNYMVLLMNMHEYAKARSLGEENLAEIRRLENRKLEMSQLEQLALLYEHAGERDKAIEALKTSHNLYVEINSNENAKKLSVLQQQFDMYRVEQERIAQQQRMELLGKELENKNLWLFISVGFGLILLVAIFFLSRRIFYQCKVNALMKKRLDQTLLNTTSAIATLRDDLGKEIYMKNKELTSFALYFVKIQNIMESVSLKIRALKLSPGMKPKERLLLNEVDTLLKQLSSNRGWQEFETYFRNVDQDFFKNLESRYPQLTPNERRLCALISLNLNSKEIATLTDRTFDSINTAKTRLKKKMNLDDNVSLYAVLSRL